MVTAHSKTMSVTQIRPRSGSLPIIETPTPYQSKATASLPPISSPQSKGRKRRSRAVTESEHQVPTNSLAALARPSKSRLSRSMDHLPSIDQQPRQRKISAYQYRDLSVLYPGYGHKPMFFSTNEDIPESEQCILVNSDMDKHETLAPAPVPSELHLPPLPSGSLTFQSAMKEFCYYNSGMHVSKDSRRSGVDDSINIAEDAGQGKQRKRKSGWNPRLAWYGPLVEYKGHHIFLSTLSSLQVAISRYSNQKWSN